MTNWLNDSWGAQDDRQGACAPLTVLSCEKGIDYKVMESVGCGPTTKAMNRAWVVERNWRFRSPPPPTHRDFTPIGGVVRWAPPPRLHVRPWVRGDWSAWGCAIEHQNYGGCAIEHQRYGSVPLSTKDEEHDESVPLSTKLMWMMIMMMMMMRRRRTTIWGHQRSALWGIKIVRWRLRRKEGNKCDVLLW